MLMYYKPKPFSPPQEILVPILVRVGTSKSGSLVRSTNYSTTTGYVRVKSSTTTSFMSKSGSHGQTRQTTNSRQVLSHILERCCKNTQSSYWIPPKKHRLIILSSLILKHTHMRKAPLPSITWFQWGESIPMRGNYHLGLLEVIWTWWVHGNSAYLLAVKWQWIQCIVIIHQPEVPWRNLGWLCFALDDPSPTVFSSKFGLIQRDHRGAQ